MQFGMKIAIFAERFPAFGGGIAVAHEALGKLLSTHHHVRFYAFSDPSSISEENVCRKRGNSLVKRFAELFLTAKVRRHAPQGDLSLVRKIASTFVNVRAMKHDITSYSPDVIIVSDDQIPLLGMHLPKRSKIIWVAHHNYSRFMNHPYLPSTCPYELFLAHRLELRASRKAHYAIFPSQYMEDVFRRTLSESLPGMVIPNYVSPLPNLRDKKILREKWQIPADKIGVFFPSGGTEIKGSRFLPEIIRRLSSTNNNLFFVVSGPIYDSLRPELDHLHSHYRILAPGPLAHTENLELASLTNLCISPALLENYSCALLECQLLGLPVITFNVGIDCPRYHRMDSTFQ
jgi:glycosyltransferase involved in cell wall biosynthesis